MKTWKKAVAVTSLGLALSLGGYFVYKHEVKSRLEQIELEKDYAKFCEEYKKLSLDGLVSKDFDYVRVKTEWQDEEGFYTTCKKGVDIHYRKNYKSDIKTLYKDNGQYNESKISFDVWLTMGGKPYGITGMTHKWEADYWGRYHLGIDKMVTFYKLEHEGKFYYFVDGDGYIYNELSRVRIKDEKLLKQVEELFEAASKDYQLVDSLTRKQ